MNPTCARSRRYWWTGGVPRVRVLSERLQQDASALAFNDTDTGEVEVGSDNEDELALVCASCFEPGPGVVECSECLRGFHVFGGEGCNPLGLCSDEGEAVLASGAFKCPNCMANRHQCHSCGKEGSCAEPNATLFMCLLSNCNLLHCSDCQRGEARKTICPRHVCAKCGRISSNSDVLIECDRCSVSYHKECLPDSLKFSERVRCDEARMICTNHHAGDGKKAIKFADDVLAQWKATTLKENQGLQCRKRVQVKRHNFPLEGTGELLEPSETNACEAAILDSCEKHPTQMISCHPSNDRIEKRKIVWEAPDRRLAKRRACDEALEEIDDDYLFGCGDTDGEVQAEIRQHLQSPKNVKGRLKVFYPHDNDPPRPVPWSRLKNFERLKMDAGNQQVDAEVLELEEERFIHIRQTIERFLGPILHGDRYTSFGRHFTKDEVMRRVVDKVMMYMAHEDMVVDMTCGANTFVPMVKDRSRKLGAKIDGKAFDVIVPFNTDDWVQESWFNVQSQDLCTNIDHLVVGLNPPFGMNGNLAGKFVQHAATLDARLIFLIVPPKTKNPQRYKVIYEDDELCRKKGSRDHKEKGAAFFLPSNNLESWSAVTPHFRILERTDPPIVTNLRYVVQPSATPSPLLLDGIGCGSFHQTISKISNVPLSSTADRFPMGPPPPRPSIFEAPGVNVVSGTDELGDNDERQSLVPVATFLAPVTIHQPVRVISERPVNCDPMTASPDGVLKGHGNEVPRLDGNKTRDYTPAGCGTMTLANVWGVGGVSKVGGGTVNGLDLGAQRVRTKEEVSYFPPPEQHQGQQDAGTGPYCNKGFSSFGSNSIGVGGQSLRMVGLQHQGWKKREIRTTEVIEYENGAPLHPTLPGRQL